MTDIHTLLALAAVAFTAGFFDAIAGGGGLITLPALMIAGFNPANAIATNKVQASAATLSATAAYAKKGLIDWKAGRLLVLLAGGGGMVGALLVSFMNKTLLQAFVPILLILVAAYFFFAPSLSQDRQKQKMSLVVFSMTIVPLLGAYDGFFGPGTGSFFMVGMVALCGLSIMQAVGLSKLANAASNVGSLSIFMLSGLIVWPVAISMAIASFLGAQLGAKAAVRVGPRLIKPMIITMSLLLATKLLSDEHNPLREWLASLIGG